jgi:hypothetical protein
VAGFLGPTSLRCGAARQRCALSGGLLKTLHKYLFRQTVVSLLMTVAILA